MAGKIAKNASYSLIKGNNIRSQTLTPFTSFLICSLAACWTSDTDISDDELYTDVIGKVYITQQALWLAGVDTEGKVDKTDIYYLVLHSQAQWRYTTEEHKVKPGTQFKVIKILKCPSCSVDEGKLEIAFQEEVFPLKDQIPIYILRANFNELFIKTNPDRIKLNEEYFKKNDEII